MTQFLRSPCFVRLAQDFGWPPINTWLTLRIPSIEDIRNKPFLAITRQPILPYSSLTELNMKGQLCGWNVCQWQLLNVVFLDVLSQDQDNYRMGYLAAEENLPRLGE